MAHLPARPPRGAGLFVRLAYFLTRRRLGRVPAPLGIMAYHRAILAGAGSFELALERAKVVDARLKELAMVKAASLVGCRFCIDIGAAIAHGHGVSEAKLRALPVYETSDVYDPLERLVLDFTVQMTQTPATPDPHVFLALRERLGTAGVVELVGAIAWENFRARFNHAVGATEEGFSEGAVCLLPAADAAVAPDAADAAVGAVTSLEARRRVG